jgi:hypothetical protein
MLSAKASHTVDDCGHWPAMFAGIAHLAGRHPWWKAQDDTVNNPFHRPYHILHHPAQA